LWPDCGPAGGLVFDSAVNPAFQARQRVSGTVGLKAARAHGCGLANGRN